MTNALNIDIQRTGFPIKIGTVELWFDSSLENLRRFFKVEELAQEKLKEAQEKADKLVFPEKVDIETLDVNMVDAAMDVNKDFIAAQYDIVFGDGTFAKVYKKYPDILALEQTLEIVGVAIGKKLEELEAERSKQTNAKKAEYLTKKLLKK
ncbi:hypothetical protein [Sporosarcina sp. FSL K6-2383]|uniref:hypothetical protein n=1 Tax=Sporosarcina sp. FSL K6-2383 TaxID=2921556 RepID=UPI00315AAA74